MNRRTRTFIGLTLRVVGVSLATVISWTVNTSIFWATVHGILGWFYIIYYALGFGV